MFAQCLRQTGRTTAMLTEAIRLAKQEETVVVVAANAREVQRLKRQLHEMDPELAAKITVNTSNERAEKYSQTMSQGIARHHLLVDHFAIENDIRQGLPFLAEQLARWQHHLNGWVLIPPDVQDHYAYLKNFHRQVAVLVSAWTSHEPDTIRDLLWALLQDPREEKPDDERRAPEAISHHAEAIGDPVRNAVSDDPGGGPQGGPEQTPG